MIASSIAPEPGEPVFEKHFNSAFRQTGLDAHLRLLGAKHLLLCGMQTEYCVDTSVKVAFELGYTVNLPVGGTTTFDNRIFKAADLITYYERYIWAGSLAKVLPVENPAGRNCYVIGSLTGFRTVTHRNPVL